MERQRLSLLTTSCRWYDDVLDIHEKLYAIHWRDCPYKRYLVMDEVRPNADYLKTYDEVIITGKESGKKNHQRISIALSKINTPYVIFLQEDMLLYDRVDTERIEQLLDFSEKYDIGALRLIPFLGCDTNYGVPYESEKELIEYPVGTPYRVSYAPSIWKKDFLLDISKQFEYGADFERKGSALSDAMNESIMGSKYVAYPYINGILRGKWELPAVRHLSYYKIEPDFSRHALMNAKDVFKQSVLGYIYNLNPKAVLRVQNRTKIGKSY